MKLLEYLSKEFRNRGWRRRGANEFVREKTEAGVDVAVKS